MDDCIHRQAAIDALGEEPEVWSGKDEYEQGLNNQWHYDVNAIKALPSAEPVRCKDCKHNPKYEWFGCPMSHLSEAQRPETAWCWKAERRTDDE